MLKVLDFNACPEFKKWISTYCYSSLFIRMVSELKTKHTEVFQSIPTENRPTTANRHLQFIHSTNIH